MVITIHIPKKTVPSFRRQSSSEGQRAMAEQGRAGSRGLGVSPGKHGGHFHVLAVASNCDVSYLISMDIYVIPIDYINGWQRYYRDMEII